MDEDINIPFPIRFNPLKHHRNYLLRLLETASAETIINLLDPVCNNYIDLYTGSLTSNEIGIEVIEILKSLQVFTPDEFAHWVNAHNGYRPINLKDQSEWVVRESNESERYIHLHPSRTGPLFIRFKGSTLKTVCLLRINAPSAKEKPSLNTVNRVRQQIGLSPVKKLEQGKGILHCYEKFLSAD